MRLGQIRILLILAYPELAKQCWCFQTDLGSRCPALCRQLGLWKTTVKNRVKNVNKLQQWCVKSVILSYKLTRFSLAGVIACGFQSPDIFWLPQPFKECFFLFRSLQFQWKLHWIQAEHQWVTMLPWKVRYSDYIYMWATDWTWCQAQWKHQSDIFLDR